MNPPWVYTCSQSFSASYNPSSPSNTWTTSAKFSKKSYTELDREMSSSTNNILIIVLSSFSNLPHDGITALFIYFTLFYRKRLKVTINQLGVADKFDCYEKNRLLGLFYDDNKGIPWG